uniref:Uncharacterized protein n=1 Tax=Chromera velia CCMP2878 TaxID=1169474 RepID=A0A0G4HI66_9ALVE|mmetsp:Transcript_47990/g.94737  ORF Transcript_47990/g.94737 Transcript_47990/m.94737 type:complete len:318 (-) Transcript_47990:326-1279(-)|eukprot:Cvel_6918.t1-p1 / transcript=Cvel_6918.t1 / gene=Cvel_6918 / organism=Chromera_velia_CCMP2878 / gene_product=hypothetical protein / transcript_product=hypothetical protein / location=Cvel_scaffold350:21488-22438(-) / protein_length=317 / sequence_SO=supercontig / SO=protein_coding / is_pseudo=false
MMDVTVKEEELDLVRPWDGEKREGLGESGDRSKGDCDMPQGFSSGGHQRASLFPPLQETALYSAKPKQEPEWKVEKKEEGVKRESLGPNLDACLWSQGDTEAQKRVEDCIETCRANHTGAVILRSADDGKLLRQVERALQQGLLLSGQGGWMYGQLKWIPISCSGSFNIPRIGSALTDEGIPFCGTLFGGNSTQEWKALIEKGNAFQGKKGDRKKLTRQLEQNLPRSPCMLLSFIEFLTVRGALELSTPMKCEAPSASSSSSQFPSGNQPAAPGPSLKTEHSSGPIRKTAYRPTLSHPYADSRDPPQDILVPSGFRV